MKSFDEIATAINKAEAHFENLHLKKDDVVELLGRIHMEIDEAESVIESLWEELTDRVANHSVGDSDEKRIDVV
jgi:hypothetical protein